MIYVVSILLPRDGIYDQSLKNPFKTVFQFIDVQANISLDNTSNTSQPYVAKYLNESPAGISDLSQIPFARYLEILIEQKLLTNRSRKNGIKNWKNHFVFSELQK